MRHLIETRWGTSLRRSRRLQMALVCLLVAVTNLTANACWLATGDVHRPNLHVTMRGGWAGFWITTTMAAGFLLAAVVLFGRERARLMDDDRDGHRTLN